MCAWVYPEWVRWFPWIEVFLAEITAPGWTSEKRLVSCVLNMENEGILEVTAEFITVQNSEFMEIHQQVFKMNNSLAIHEILRSSVVDKIEIFCLK